MSDKNTFNIENLKSLIDKHTREEIAKGIGCDTSLVTKHYNGDRNITLDYAIKYADFFGVSIDYICGRTQNKTVDDELRFVCDYTGLSQTFIETLKGTFVDFIKYSTVAESEIEYVKKNYNDILLIMLQNNFFLWNIMQSKLSLISRIGEEQRIKQLLDDNKFSDDAQKEIGVNIYEVLEGYRYGNYDRINLKKFLALEECRKIIDEYLKDDLKEYQDLLKENQMKAQHLRLKEIQQSIYFSGGDNNANS